MLDMGQQDNYYSVDNTINLRRNNCYKVKKNQPVKMTTISIHKSLTLQSLVRRRETEGIWFNLTKAPVGKSQPNIHFS